MPIKTRLHFRHLLLAGKEYWRKDNALTDMRGKKSRIVQTVLSPTSQAEPSVSIINSAVNLVTVDEERRRGEIQRKFLEAGYREGLFDQVRPTGTVV